jgi:hypothetical protein
MWLEAWVIGSRAIQLKFILYHRINSRLLEGKNRKKFKIADQDTKKYLL